MLYFLIGCAGFALFFLSDTLQIVAPARGGAKLFFPGLALLLVGTGGLLFSAPRMGADLLSPRSLLFLGMGAAFLWLLLHSLFFSLPKETYRASGDGRPLCDTGLYALCRHPGVLFFAALYACLWLAFGGELLLLAAVTYCALNLLYGLLQDRWVFPRLFAGYSAYRSRAPFLLPNRGSIRACIETWNGTDASTGKRSPQRGGCPSRREDEGGADEL